MAPAFDTASGNIPTMNLRSIFVGGEPEAESVDWTYR